MRQHVDSRRLAKGQVSELVVANRDGSGEYVVYETTSMIEAPN